MLLYCYYTYNRTHLKCIAKPPACIIDANCSIGICMFLTIICKEHLEQHSKLNCVLGRELDNLYKIVSI